MPNSSECLSFAPKEHRTSLEHKVISESTAHVSTDLLNVCILYCEQHVSTAMDVHCSAMQWGMLCAQACFLARQCYERERPWLKLSEKAPILLYVIWIASAVPGTVTRPRKNKTYGCLPISALGSFLLVSSRCQTQGLDRNPMLSLLQPFLSDNSLICMLTVSHM